MNTMTIEKNEICFKIEQLSQILTNKGWYVSCAESCTGGWVAKLFTDLVGSSKWFDRGFVTYSNRAKQEMLSVSEKTLEKFGAVSEAVVQEMALGACRESGAQVSLAISGIAGPGGGSEDKPVGLVWFAWCINGQVESLSEIFDGDRDKVRQQAVVVAIEKLLHFLQSA